MFVVLLKIVINLESPFLERGQSDNNKDTSSIRGVVLVPTEHVEGPCSGSYHRSTMGLT